MKDHDEQASGRSGGSETAVPAAMMGMMERAGCRCAEMMPRMMAMCAGADHDAEAAEPAESAAAESEEGMNP